MKNVIVVTGASSGLGGLAARALAQAGHTVYASMRGTTGRNATQVAEAHRYAEEHGVDLRTVELDVASQASADAAIDKIVADNGRLDVVIQNAGYMVFGPVEAFTSEQFAELYDVNVLGPHRVNRAALPQLRKQGRGLLVWISSSCARGGTPPYMAPYFTAEAAMNSLAMSYAGKLARWGIETAIIVPGPPSGKDRASEWDAAPYSAMPDKILGATAALESADAGAAIVADAIATVVGLPPGQRPFRTSIDPSWKSSPPVALDRERISRARSAVRLQAIMPAPR